MEKFIRGPLVWIAFVVFFGGGLFKLTRFLHLAKKDKIMFPRMGVRYGLLSFLTWAFNFLETNIKKHPVLTVVTVIFHICILVTPIFLYSHVVLWYQAWDITWWALPDKVADVMTGIVIVCCLFFLFRRLFLKEVTYVTSFSDYVLIVLVIAPFITGLVTYHQWFLYEPMLIAHILSGQLFLMVLPFSRLGHMLFIFFTQAYMGSEFEAMRIAKK
jgi:nitrate reductase gamma subunit